jgi:hypothetical protein
VITATVGVWKNSRSCSHLKPLFECNRFGEKISDHLSKLRIGDNDNLATPCASAMEE